MPRTSPDTKVAHSRRGQHASTGIVLDRLPAPIRKSRYPWREWVDGSARVIWYPKHFQAGTAGMRSTIVTHAQKRDIAVAVVMHPEHPHAPPEVSLAFQFFPERTFEDGPPRDLFAS